MTTLLAFIAALAVLITVHEYGHYKMARWCGVKVLQFSIGFGRPLFTWRYRQQPTEFVIAAIPLGGFVRMLDEREGVVAPEERHLAFNTQPLHCRVLIVLAGPVANLLLAVLLFAAVGWYGVAEPKAVLSSPAAGSLAARAGLQARDTVLQASVGSAQSWEDIQGFEQLRWLLTRAVLDADPVYLDVQRPGGARLMVSLPLDQLQVGEPSMDMYRRIGLLSPWSAPVMGEIQPGSPAGRAGLRKEDEVLSVDGSMVSDAGQLRQRIREGVPPAAAQDGGAGTVQHWRVRRPGVGLLELQVQPDRVVEGDRVVGRVGAFIGTRPEMVWVSRGPVDALVHALDKTWDMSVLTLRMMGRMVTGQASVKNLTGPLSIADYAGKSASLGLVSYVAFLAVISVSLGVLNLLPVPMLDGGHLMYYLWEWLTGKPISDLWLDRLQRVGMAVVFLMMSVAVFNDVARLLG